MTPDEIRERARKMLEGIFGVHQNGEVGDSITISIAKSDEGQMSAYMLDRFGKRWRVSELMAAFAESLGAASPAASPQPAAHVHYFRPFDGKCECGESIKLTASGSGTPATPEMNREELARKIAEAARQYFLKPLMHGEEDILAAIICPLLPDSQRPSCHICGSRMVHCWHCTSCGANSYPMNSYAEIAAAVQREREECAKLADMEGSTARVDGGNLARWDSCDNIAKAIRSRASEPNPEPQGRKEAHATSEQTGVSTTGAGGQIAEPLASQSQGPRCPKCGHNDVRICGDEIAEECFLFCEKCNYSVTSIKNWGEFFPASSAGQAVSRSDEILMSSGQRDTKELAGEGWIPCAERLPNDEEVERNKGWFAVANYNRQDVAKLLKRQDFMGHALQFGDVLFWSNLRPLPAKEGK